jgi:hypothetical protein
LEGSKRDFREGVVAVVEVAVVAVVAVVEVAVAVVVAP